MGQLACCASPDSGDVAKNVNQIDNILAQHSSSIKTKFTDAKQAHIFDGYEKLTEEEKTTLMKDCYQVDPSKINSLYEKLVQNKDKQQKDGPLEVVEPELVKDFDKLSKEDLDKYTATGSQIIKSGKAAVVLLAGGQGTRLGFKHSKGMYKIGLLSEKSIFQVLVEKFIRAQMVAHGSESMSDDIQRCKMLIMTSQANHKETVAFFKKNKFFGASEKSFVFFQQDMLPQVNLSGKLILESKDHLKMGPNGNGGFFQAVANNEDVKKVLKNTEYVQFVGVDNIINKILDPVFVGYTKENSLHAAGKACLKRDADEKVGVFCKRKANGKMVYDIAEYSEISKNDVEAKNEDGSLKFGLGYILILMVNSQVLLKLLEKEGINQMYHVAKKKADTYNATSGKVTPARRENAYKFELFLHSFLMFLSPGKFGVLNVDRATEFAPIKNANGENVQDSPATARAQIYAEAQQWLEKNGFTVKNTAIGAIEIDPLLSFRGENMDKIRRQRSQEFTLPTLIDRNGNCTEVIPQDADQNVTIVLDTTVDKKEDVEAEIELLTKEKAEAAKMSGPYLGTEREKILKDLLKFVGEQKKANHPEVKRDNSKNLVIRQDLEGEVPLTYTEVDVPEIPFDKFKTFMKNWFENVKQFDSKATVTSPETIDGCTIAVIQMQLPWPLDNRTFISCFYTVPFADGTMAMVASARGNESLKEKYTEQIGKNVYGEQKINFFKISPINDGKGTHVSHMAQAHIGGKILGPFKAKMAEKQQTIALEQIEKINAAINK